MSFQLRRRVHLLLPVLLLLLVHIAAAAPAPRIELTTPGFSLRVREDFWGPLGVRVGNPGGEVSLQLVYQQDAGASGVRLTQRHPLLLPAGVSVSTVAPVYMARYNTAGGVPVPLGTVLIETADGRELDREQLLARVGQALQPGVLVSDERRSSYVFLDEVDFGNGRRPALRMPVAPGDLPLRAEMLHGVDLLILGQVDEDGLRADAWAAIDLWVRSGGMLVYSPAGDTPLQPPPGLAALLPVYYAGRDTVSTYRPGPEADGSLVAEEGIDRYAMLEVEGERLAGTEAHPVAVFRRHGHGAVIALDVDTGSAAFQQWEGARDFVSSILPSVSPLPRYAGRLLTADGGAAAESIMLELSGREVPSRGRVGLILAMVVAVLGGSIGVGRRLDHPLAGWAGAGLAAVVLGGGLLAAAAARRSDAEPLRTLLSVQMPAPDGAGTTVHAIAGCYSPTERTFQIVPRAAAAVAAPLRSLTQPPELLALGWDRTGIVDAMPVRTDTLRMVGLQANDTEIAPSPVVRLRPGADGFAVTVDNATPRALHRGLIRHHRMGLWVPAIEAQATWSETGLVPVPGGEGGALMMSRADQMRRRTLDLLFARGGEDIGDWDHRGMAAPLPVKAEQANAWFYGWTSGDGILGVVDDVREGGVNIVRAPVVMDWETGPVRLPPGCLPRDVAYKAPGMRLLPHGPASGMRSGLAVFEFRAPEGMPALRIDRARVVHEFVGTGYDVGLLVRMGPADVGRSRLEGFNPVGADGLIPEAAGGGLPIAVAFRLDMSDVDMSAWKLDYLELEIEGTLHD